MIETRHAEVDHLGRTHLGPNETVTNGDPKASDSVGMWYLQPFTQLTWGEDRAYQVLPPQKELRMVNLPGKPLAKACRNPWQGSCCWQSRTRGTAMSQLWLMEMSGMSETRMTCL